MLVPLGLLWPVSNMVTHGVENKFWRATLGFVLLGFPFKISDEPLRHSYIWRPSLKADIADS